MSGGLRSVFRTRSEVFDLEAVTGILLLFINVQIDTVEVEQAMRQFVTSQGLHLHAFYFLRVRCLPEVLEFIAGIKTAADLLQQASTTGFCIVIIGWVSA